MHSIYFARHGGRPGWIAAEQAGQQGGQAGGADAEQSVEQAVRPPPRRGQRKGSQHAGDDEKRQQRGNDARCAGAKALQRAGRGGLRREQEPGGRQKQHKQHRRSPHRNILPEPERNAESEHRMSPGDRMKRGKNLAQRLTLPQEVVSQGPLAELHGNTSVCIENHGGILEYTDTRVCIAVQRGTLTVSGCGLRILRMTQRRVEIGGTIRCVEVS